MTELGVILGAFHFIRPLWLLLLPAIAVLWWSVRRTRCRRDLPAAVAGPSSIGNYLATLGIPATSGFGVTYRNLHAADECIQLASIAPTYAAYLGALRELLSRPQRS